MSTSAISLFCQCQGNASQQHHVPFVSSDLVDFSVASVMFISQLLTVICMRINTLSKHTAWSLPWICSIALDRRVLRRFGRLVRCSYRVNHHHIRHACDSELTTPEGRCIVSYLSPLLLAMQPSCQNVRRPIKSVRVDSARGRGRGPSSSLIESDCLETRDENATFYAWSSAGIIHSRHAGSAQIAVSAEPFVLMMVDAESGGRRVVELRWLMSHERRTVTNCSSISIDSLISAKRIHVGKV